MQYCLPLLHTACTQVEAQLHQHQQDYSHFEIWLDELDDLTPEWVSQIAQQWGERLIFLFRRPGLAPPKMPQDVRHFLFSTIAKTESHVDFDMQTQRQDLHQWQKWGPMKRVILSYHDYHKTPSDEDLLAIMEAMMEYKPWICKVATFCQSRLDALRLLELCHKLSTHWFQQSFICLGMGEHGLLTRIFGPLWGNALTFAPVSLAAASAPGQLSREQYRQLFAVLEQVVPSFQPSEAK